MTDEGKEKEKEMQAQKNKEKEGEGEGEGEGEKKKKKKPIDDEMYREGQRAVREICHERALKPALVYLHGGGFISGSVKLFRKDIIRYVNMTSMTIYAPEYRLAPEHKFPKPLEDAFAAAQWIRENAAAENIDPERIGLLGVSAGGALALGVAMMWQDKGIEPPIGRVCAVYPMLNHQSTAVSDSKRAKFVNIWTEKGIKLA
jgi:Esterase/lipase